MKLIPSARCIARRIGLAVCFLLLLFLAQSTLRAEGPPWWTNRNVLISGAVTNDYAAINMGQLKQLAANAYTELELLPSGVGNDLAALLDDWLPDGTNYCAVNVGQLKHVASLVYDRLIVANYTDAYPWTDDSGVSDFSAAAIGQAKYLFGFDISSDTDGDGLPDWWETRHFGSTTNWGSADDPDEDDMPNLWEFTYILNPNDVSDGSGDIDEDGFLNVYECIHGSSPTDPIDIPLPTTMVTSNIQDAIDACSSYYGIVGIPDGEYRGTGNKNLSFRGKRIMVTSLSDSDHCIIDCENSGRGVLFDGREGALSVLHGICIRAGREDSWGAGIKCLNTSPTLSDCRIEDCYATMGGGGLYADSSFSVIDRVQVFGCVARRGGAVYTTRGNPIFRNCLIAENGAFGAPWGYSAGGGVVVSSGDALLVNCSIADNRCASAEGSAVVVGGAHAEMRNCIVWGHGIRKPIAVHDSGTLSASHSCIGGGWPGEGNTNAEIRIGSPAYALLSGSPCTDAGTDQAVPFFDIAGRDRWDDPATSNLVSAVDIGAHEFVDSDGDQLPDWWELRHFSGLHSDTFGDPDEDHLSNFWEMQSGNNPTNSSLLMVKSDRTTATFRWREPGASPDSYEYTLTQWFPSSFLYNHRAFGTLSDSSVRELTLNRNWEHDEEYRLELRGIVSGRVVTRRILVWKPGHSDVTQSDLLLDRDILSTVVNLWKEDDWTSYRLSPTPDGFAGASFFPPEVALMSYVWSPAEWGWSTPSELALGPALMPGEIDLTSRIPCGNQQVKIEISGDGALDVGPLYLLTRSYRAEWVAMPTVVAIDRISNTVYQCSMIVDPSSDTTFAVHLDGGGWVNISGGAQTTLTGTQREVGLLGLVASTSVGDAHLTAHANSSTGSVVGTSPPFTVVEARILDAEPLSWGEEFEVVLSPSGLSGDFVVRIGDIDHAMGNLPGGVHTISLSDWGEYDGAISKIEILWHAGATATDWAALQPWPGCDDDYWPDLKARTPDVTGTNMLICQGRARFVSGETKLVVNDPGVDIGSMTLTWDPEDQPLVVDGEEDGELVISCGGSWPKEFLVERLQSPWLPREITVRLRHRYCTDDVTLTLVPLEVDLDVDSDNNDGYDDEWERTSYEDGIEAQPLKSGKILSDGWGDDDDDDVPNFADGFDIYGNEGSDAVDNFAPMIVEIPYPIDPAAAAVRFRYLSSSPSNITRTIDEPYEYTPALGHLRIWTKKADASRMAARVQDGGDFIEHNRRMSFADLSPDRKVTLYVEGIRHHEDQLQIHVDVNPAANDPTLDYLYTDTVNLTVPRIDIAMDGNRNDTIDFDDPEDAEYLFWVNDDHDCLHYEESEWHEDDSTDWASGAPDPNCADDRIGGKGYLGGTPPSASENHCRRDLEDFTRLHLFVDDSTVRMSGITYWMKFENTGGTSPQVNIFKAVNENLDYLQVGQVADQQIRQTRLITVGSSEEQFASEYIKEGNLRSPFIIEGKTAGKGDLTIIIKKDGEEIGKKSTTLELRPITSFYQVFQIATVGENSEDISDGYNPDFTSSDDYLLFVHGFNVNVIDKAYWPGTVLKRLWWQGYKGHVGFFDWPCVMFSYVNLQCYDDSESNALHCASALNHRIDELNSGAALGKVRLLAHSQGNVIAGEAVRLASSQIVHTYIASQAAVASDAYQGGLAEYLSSPDTPNVYLSYPPTGNPWFAGVSTKAGQCFSYFNPGDYALHSVGFGSWEWNNEERPDAKYHYSEGDNNLDTYDPVAGDRFYFDSILPCDERTMAFPVDEYEIFSYSAEARCSPLGMQDAMTEFSEFDLRTMPLPYNTAHYSHSRQFRSNIVDEWSYWERVILNCGF